MNAGGIEAPETSALHQQACREGCRPIEYDVDDRRHDEVLCPNHHEATVVEGDVVGHSRITKGSSEAAFEKDLRFCRLHRASGAGSHNHEPVSLEIEELPTVAGPPGLTPTACR